jgi:hypothetical protein
MIISLVLGILVNSETPALWVVVETSPKLYAD